MGLLVVVVELAVDVFVLVLQVAAVEDPEALQEWRHQRMLE